MSGKDTVLFAPVPVHTIRDRRLGGRRSLNSLFPMDQPASLAEWEGRRREIRERILMATGLDPMPEPTPLGVRIYGEIPMPGYTVSRVVFESLPGFYVTGNLYTPESAGALRPAVLNPHGHWENGRFEVSDTGNIPIRCAVMARMGMTAFSYDMVGYGDSRQMPHSLPWSRETVYDGVGLMGIQLYNSIRALDFVLGLPGTDPDRIYCTGASGGGTQTFLLTAVDDRIAAAAPVNMISAHMQGGCRCENAPLLRIGLGNIEIAACAAPRPMLMVSSTGDWTCCTPDCEYPALRGIYSLYGAQSRLTQYHQDAGHNYNRNSRERVYAWLSDLTGLEVVSEDAVRIPDTSRLRIGEDWRPDPVDEKRYLEIRNRYQKKTEDPEVYRTRLGALLGKDTLPSDLRPVWHCRQTEGDITALDGCLASTGTEHEQNPMRLLYASGCERASLVLCAHPLGRDALRQDDQFRNEARQLVGRGYRVCVPDLYLTGEPYRKAASSEDRPEYDEAYNETDDVRRICDIAALAEELDAAAVLGYGRFGGLCALAAALLDKSGVLFVAEIGDFGAPDVPLLGLYGGVRIDLIGARAAVAEARRPLAHTLPG
ncbi:MAG: hypothetical protein GX549_08770 [Clostridiales bacterium]|nr:hypothetical protein [Clostridiales bacterium]